MEKVKSFLEEHVANIAIVLGSVGIISHILLIYFPKLRILGRFAIIGFQDPIQLFLTRFNGHQLNFHILPILFLSMLIVGGISYKITEGSDARLLKFGFSIIAIKNILAIFLTPINYLNFSRMIAKASNYSGEPISIFTYVWSLLILIPMAYCTFYLTKWLIRKSQLDVEVETLENEKKQFSFFKVSKTKRFAHMLFDLFLMALIIWPIFTNLISYFSGDYFSSFPRWMNNRFFFGAVIGILSIIYYLIFEGLFNATPIKFLTGSVVVNKENMERPGFAKILARSFSRRIPFEAFSFFGDNGWHDSISGTTVVPEKIEQKFGVKNFVWMLILLGIYIGSVAYSIIAKEMKQSRKNDFHTTNTIYQKKATLENLDRGDLLIFDSFNGRYTDEQSVVVVGNTTENEVSGIHYLVHHKHKTNRANFLEKGINEFWEMQGQVALNLPQLTEGYLDQRKRVAVTLGEKKYMIKTIEDIQNPTFKSSSSSSRHRDGESTQSLNVSFDATPIEILSIENIEGKPEWTNEFPLRPSFNSQRSSGYFPLEVKGKLEKYSKSKMKLKYNDKEEDYIIFKLGSSLIVSKALKE